MTPIDSARLRQTSHYDALTDLANAEISGPNAGGVVPPSADMLREALALTRALRSTPGAAIDRYRHLALDHSSSLHGVVSDLTRLAFYCEPDTDYPGSFARTVRVAIEHADLIKAGNFTIADSMCGRHVYMLPLDLKCRQMLLAHIAGMLASEPCRSIDIASMSRHERSRLVSLAGNWPTRCTNTLVPEVAEWISADRKLQVEFKMSPEYFARRRALQMFH